MTTKAALKDIVDDTPNLLLRADLGHSTNDPKLPGSTPAVYVIEQDKALAEKACGGAVAVRTFSMKGGGREFMEENAAQGLLFLPYPYLVPGGRFNEMYGWDTAFPVFAWGETHPKLMREQADNQLYQIRAYGKVLNANRTYYLSRSQPPMIAAMVLHLWKVAAKKGWAALDPDGVYKDARGWLAEAYEDLKRYHTYWTTGYRLAAEGLSRYWDEGDMRAIEVVKSEPGHYKHAIAHFEQHPDPRFCVEGRLTALYYRADRAMRASGFDPTGHWGYGGLECMFHAPLCLNSLLYRMEGDMAEIAAVLGDAADWKEKQAARLRTMQTLMRDPETGIYHDYNIETQQLNRDPFATFFHALWAGLYDGDRIGAEQAARAVLAQLETEWGVSTSTRESGSQWDHPYGWPPLQYFAFTGLARAGLAEDARRIAQKYVSLAGHVFGERNSLFEKYNLKDGSADVHVVHGYSVNVNEGGTFLWTAAVLQMAQDAAK